MGQKAYSYVRFSTPDQARGDSYRRQTEAAARYAASHNLELDGSLNLEDLGVSAYRGANVETGALGGFFRAIEDGVVQEGSVLLVEALDRISRKTARMAVRVLEDIVDAGVDVVTLSDSKRYTKESLNGFDFLMAVLLLIRGNEESQMKSRRLKSAWDAKRARAGEKYLTRTTPGWLKIQNEQIVPIPERTAVVRRIFDLFLAGNGKQQIASALNEEKVPLFGRGQHWHKSYIFKILNNPAVTGVFVPHSTEYDEHGVKRRVPQDPVPDYFPRAIDAETFERAQTLILAGTPIRGKHTTRPMQNLLAGLAKCPKCGSTMTRVSKGPKKKAGHPFLVCTKAKVGAGCDYVSVRLDVVEEAITSRADDIARNVPHPDASIQDDLEGASYVYQETMSEIDHLLDALARRPLASISKQIQILERRAAKQKHNVEAIQNKAAQSDSRLIRKRAERLEAALTAKPLDKQVANAALRECFEHVIVDYRHSDLKLKWRHGDSLNFMYEWPKERRRRKASENQATKSVGAS
jgi:DNA invertase Pin-like site-specific DNA recombinase